MIFEYDYSGQLTADSRYEIPDGMAVRRCDACQVQWSTDEIWGKKSYVDSLEVQVSASFGWGPAKFSASTDYKRVETGSNSQHSMFTKSTARCYAYCGGLLTYALPKVSKNFAAAVKGLPKTYSDDYFALMEVFGTHYTNDISMGSSFGQMSKIKDTEYLKMTETDLNVKSSASFSAWGASASFSTMTDKERKDSESFKTHTDWQAVYSVGGKPPADGKPASWLKAAITEPMPMKYTLVNISTLFTQQNFGADSDIAVKQANMQRALEEYCQRLVQKGVISSCNPPDPDPEPPQPPNSCRLCADSCGGGYNKEVASFSNDQKWPNWFTGLDSKCSGKLAHHSYNTAVKMCCTQPNKPDGSTGDEPCRVCADACGGSFPSEVGAMSTDQKWPGFFSSYQPQCKLEYGVSAYTQGLKVCCQKQLPPCRMCTTCGSDWPVVAGSLSADQAWPNFFKDWGQQCQGNYGHNSYDHLDGVKMCCSR
jgi:hypothetical protein